MNLIVNSDSSVLSQQKKNVKVQLQEGTSDANEASDTNYSIEPREMKQRKSLMEILTKKHYIYGSTHRKHTDSKR